LEVVSITHQSSHT